MHGCAGATLPPTSPTVRLYNHYYIFFIRHTLDAAAVLAFSSTVPLLEITFMVLLPYLLAPRKPNLTTSIFPASTGGSTSR